MDAFIASLSLVTLAEIGDKTQLLSLLLAARYRRPIPIILGILVATTLNHALAAYVGHWLTDAISPFILQSAIALLFILLGLWILQPDSLKVDEKETTDRGAFLAATIAFFLAEMGDKTQLATIALGAHYANLFAVVIGTTVGMMIANIPAVLLGDKILKLVPLHYVRYGACALFVLFGVWQVVMIMNPPA